MSEYEVTFAIEAPNIGDATNRAMVALYKGDLDAHEVCVVERSSGLKFKFKDKPGTKLASGGVVKNDPSTVTPTIKASNDMANVVIIDKKIKF